MESFELLEQLIKDYPYVRFQHGTCFDLLEYHITCTGKTYIRYSTPDECRLYGKPPGFFETALLHEVGHVERGPYEKDAWNWVFENAERYGVAPSLSTYTYAKGIYLNKAPWAWDYHWDVFGTHGANCGFSCINLARLTATGGSVLAADNSNNFM